MTRFPLVPDDFGRLSIEIINDCALGRTAKAGLRLRLLPFVAPVTRDNAENRSLVSRSATTRALHRKELKFDTFMHQVRASDRPHSLFAGDNRENSGFGEVASGARRKTDRQDFLDFGSPRRS